MNYSIKIIPTAEIEVPCPEVYWMESFAMWTKLRFQVAIIRSEDKIILVNTGFPDNITEISKAWKDGLGERAILKRSDAQKMTSILKREGIKPENVTHVIITPLQLYTTGNLHLFKNAKICCSRKGWIEDIIAPSYHHHVPRRGCISDEHLQWLLTDNNHNLLLLDDSHSLFDGLTVKWIGVHHRSSVIIEVTTQTGLVGISDCAFHYSNVEDNRPLGIAESIIEAHTAYKYIREHIKIFIPLYDPVIQERHNEGVITE